MKAGDAAVPEAEAEEDDDADLVVSGVSKNFPAIRKARPKACGVHRRRRRNMSTTMEEEDSSDDLDNNCPINNRLVFFSKMKIRFLLCYFFL